MLALIFPQCLRLFMDSTPAQAALRGSWLPPALRHPFPTPEAGAVEELPAAARGVKGRLVRRVGSLAGARPRRHTSSSCLSGSGKQTPSLFYLA